jgi:hypothetical protein
MSILLTLIFPLQLILSQSDSIEAIHWDWVREDSVFISDWVYTAKNNPAKITEYFPLPQKPFTVDTLGFGYSFYESSSGKGYVTCYYSLVLRDGKLISFELHPEMPHHRDLDSIYIKLYSSLFQISFNSGIKPFRWNDQLMESPILDKRFMLRPASIIDPDVKNVMTPYIGVEYGYCGGEASQMLSSRQAFQKIKNRLNDSVVVNLLHSVNPATRLMAVEYVERNNYQTSIPLNSLKHDIAIILEECPQVLTLRGCIRDTENAKDLLREFLGNQKLK